MEQENKQIFDFDLKMIADFFRELDRQGPGGVEQTLRALEFVPDRPGMRIADIGCGTGGQTITIARNRDCTITAVDLLPELLEEFRTRIKKAGLENRVTAIQGSMDALPFSPGEFDVIWAEGSIYNIGFERALAEWRKFLKPGGYIAITENTWFREEQPQEIKNFWQEAYPQIDTIPTKVAQMQKAGYLPVATYMLPETIWTDYYKMQAANGESFLKKYKGNKTVEEFIASQRYEAELYDKYKAYYGYVFYIGKKL